MDNFDGPRPPPPSHVHDQDQGPLFDEDLGQNRPAPPFEHSFSTSVSQSIGINSGAFFPNSRHLTVNNGIFTSYVTQHMDTPGAVRTIPFCDIDLQYEIQAKYGHGAPTAVVSSRRRKRVIRKLYSARVRSAEQNTANAVAIYEGPDAQKKWFEDIAKYLELRDPHLVQLYAIASVSSELCAAIFHDDLVPFDKYCIQPMLHSPLLTAYVVTRGSSDFKSARRHWEAVMRGRPLPRFEEIFWARASTRRICVEYADAGPCPSEAFFWPLWEATLSLVDHGITNELPSETEIMSLLSLREFEMTMFRYLARCLEFNLPIEAYTHLYVGSVVQLSSLTVQAPVEATRIAFLPDFRPAVRCPLEWRFEPVYGWKRVSFDEIRTLGNNGLLEYCRFFLHSPWLSQANHIFHALGITENLHDYGFISRIDFLLRVDLLQMEQCHQEGFLFICPWEELLGPTTGGRRWAERPTYWSLDPSGAPALSPEEAEHLGLPSPQFSTRYWIRTWEDKVYEALRGFHIAKGFDPYSQEVARHQNYPLYEADGTGIHALSRIFEVVEDDVDTTKGLVSETQEFDAVPSSWINPISVRLALIILLGVLAMHKYLLGMVQ